MGDPKPVTATRAIIKSILWSIGATFAILGSIEMFAYSGDGVPYFIIASVFGVLWAVLEAKRIHRKNDHEGGVAK